MFSSKYSLALLHLLIRKVPQILQEVFPLTEPSANNLRFQPEFGTRPKEPFIMGLIL